MWYKQEKAKTKEDYINLLKEIEAYRELDGQDFDFGTGLIINEMSYGSEDAYYEMDIQMIEDILEYWDYGHQPKNSRKTKLKKTRYELKKKQKDKLKFLKKVHWSLVSEKDGWNQRIYRGRRSSYLKKISNKKVRNFKGNLSNKSNMYHKIFDFWWEYE